MATPSMSARKLRFGMNFYPPFLGAGIRVLHLAEDYRSARVRLRLNRLTRNYVGTQFGGSLFAMTDPFWMLMVLHNLGQRYIVWDQAAEIDFVAPGRGDVFAEFLLTEDRLTDLREQTEGGDKTLAWFHTDVTMADGTVVARVRKQLYVRHKPQR